MNSERYLMINNSIVIIPKTKYTFMINDSSPNSFTSQYGFTPIEHQFIPPRNRNPIPDDPRFNMEDCDECYCQQQTDSHSDSTSNSYIDNSDEMIFSMEEDDFSYSF